MPQSFLFRSVSVLLAVPSATASQLPASDRWPVADPDQENIDGKTPNALFAHLATDPTKDLKGMVILRRGKLGAESYFDGDDLNTLHDIRSATKSITATLMVITMQQHLVRGADDSTAGIRKGASESRAAARRLHLVTAQAENCG